MHNELHAGRDGWLFLTGGSNQVLRFYTEPHFFGPEQRAAWQDMLGEREARARACGAGYCHVIAPEKLSVYPEFYDGELPFIEHAPSRCLAPGAGAGAPQVVDLRPRFAALKQAGEQLYFKTDTHWTHAGAFAAADAVCRHFGLDIGPQFLERPLAEAQLTLDLGGKLQPPVSERWTMRTGSGRLTRIAASDMVVYKEAHGAENEPGLHVGCSVALRNATPTVRARLVLYGDSFSEYRDHLMMGALAETFEETHFVWSSQLDWNHIAALRPDFVVSELAERFMNVVPSAEIDLRAFEQERLREYIATHTPPAA
jgi:hypothetical protein